MKNKLHIKNIEDENFVYHCFSFDPKIQEHTFLGEEFIGLDQSDKVSVIDTFERVIDAGPDGFMPKLVAELQNILGEGNYVYDGYEIGEDDSVIFEYNLYFLIKETVYESLLRKVDAWSDFNGFKDLISWNNKLSNSEEN